ncbi:conserved hypothetical protein [Culex quinquefasciatus]|uniref:Uncharacterized protein n=1 Tax=Culex quinquefasciatus TaxID=7176 RepID=B0WKG2_CULQU|nr:conserved hypothetical protein [Culex quinquefasciatus]|eukprot:XP_001849196.1 conserved hypothetical protein [Culex quinquefasciatus]
MKLLACALWTLLALLPLVTLTFSEPSLEYILRTIDYLISVKPGVFSVVFYDAAGPDDSGNGIFDELMKSPRLNHVVKYAIASIHPGIRTDDLWIVSPTAYQRLHQDRTQGDDSYTWTELTT